VLLGMLALVFLALKAANLGSFGSGDTYRVTARFDNIGGLKARAPVRSAGVVGGPRDLDRSLDPKTFQGVVTLDIDRGFQFPKDSAAKILTAGLLGDQYIGIEPGGDDKNLAPGDTIAQTQSAVVLENLIGQFLTGKAADAGTATGGRRSDRVACAGCRACWRLHAGAGVGLRVGPSRGARCSACNRRRPLSKAGTARSSPSTRPSTRPCSSRWRQVYRDVVPQLVRTGVGNFFGNIGDVWSAANHFCRASCRAGAVEMGMRVLTNTFIGLGGVLDPASEMRCRGGPRTSARRWVCGACHRGLPGAALLRPVVVRDGAGLPLDMLRRDIRPPTTCRRERLPVDGAADGQHPRRTAGRHALLDDISLDKYSFLRDAYLSRRRTRSTTAPRRWRSSRTIRATRRSPAAARRPRSEPLAASAVNRLRLSCVEDAGVPPAA
jgi:phospholipid/cholesterol/gamma-HCH transport system substrate-binding protein